MFRCRRAIVALVLLLGSCESTAGVTWEVVVDDAIGADVVRVSLAITDQGCEEGDALFSREVTEPGGVEEAPRLPGGSYGFRGTAFNSLCHVIGRGCTAVELPDGSSEHVRTDVLPDEPELACDGCSRPDAGVADPLLFELCANRYNGELVQLATCDDESYIVIELPASRPTVFCINRYDRSIRVTRGDKCAETETAHVIPDDGPLPACINRLEDNHFRSRKSLTEACAEHARAVVIPSSCGG